MRSIWIALGLHLLLTVLLCAAQDEEYNQRMKQYNNTMLWGTYRPQVYFGMRTRTPKGVLTGIMWHNAQDWRAPENIRHTCEMSDNLSFGWTRHNGRDYGYQPITDSANQLQLSTEFIKQPEATTKGGDWAVRITGKRTAHASGTSPYIALKFYLALEDESPITIVGGKKQQGLNNPVVLSAQSKELGKYSILIKDNTPQEDTLSKAEAHLQKFHFMGYKSNGKDAWRVKDVIKEYTQSAMMKAFASPKSHKLPVFGAERYQQQQNAMLLQVPVVTLPNTFADRSNVVVVEKFVKAPFELDIALISHEGRESEIDSESPTVSEIKRAADHLVAKKLTETMKKAREAFETRFTSTFRIGDNEQFSAAQREMAMYAFSNMIGGVGYFYGDSMRSYNGGEPVRVAPYPLFTAVPSRSFFPRGFLWDEGFHLLLIGKWDKEIMKDILKHWFNTMDSDGWIAREQILGDEPRSKVPEQFQVQHNTHANPPTLFFSLYSLARSLTQNVAINVDASISIGDSALKTGSANSDDLHFLKEIYPRLERYYNWFVNSQKGQMPGTYRWRGRTDTHTLASGLDDYPRGTPTPRAEERHVDLYSWIYMSTAAMAEITNHLNAASGSAVGTANRFEDHAKSLLENLPKMHWNSDIQAFCDWVGNVNTSRNGWSEHLGYISLFPVLVGMTQPNSEYFEKTVDLMANPQQLFSPFGLRSLSVSDRFFGTEENYWRGPIWMNMNYLALRSLHMDIQSHQSQRTSDSQVKTRELYSRLRQALIKNVFNEYRKHGLLFETYSATDGHGRGAKPFTGWTSLIVLIMAELYH